MIKTVWGVAGAGKSTWLSQVLQQKERFLDWKPNKENTLCISFTRNARRVLKNKLGDGWEIFTFHSYLTRKLLKTGTINIFKQADINRWFEERGYPILRMSDDDYQVVDMNHPYSHLNRMRNLMMTPEQYVAEGLLYDAHNLYEEDFLTVAEEYLQHLRKNNLYDYTRILEEGKEKVFLDKEYVFVDEAQDLTPLMFSVIEQTNAKVLLLGDPNQAIFGFAGSKDDILGSIPPVFCLERSNRCFSEIVDYAAQYMEYAMRFVAKENGGEVEENTAFNFDYVVDDIVERLSNHSTFILTFTVKSAVDISKKLKELKVPHQLFFEDPYPKDCIRVWRLYHLPFEQLKIDDFTVLEKTGLKAKSFVKKFSKNLKHLPAVIVEELREIHQKILKLHPLVLFKSLDQDKLEETLATYQPTAGKKLNISTIHRIKGDEADTVFVLFDAPSKLPQKYVNHLLYTASTRAIRKLIIYR
jgi:superfamily I DNA/RNA helicase